MRKRRPPIAKSLINNSVSGYFSAIEIHNKPAIKYRYEVVVLLILNAWELLLKGYLYKFHKDVKLFHRDGTTKPFESCVNIVNLKIGKEFNSIKENLVVLYEYRNRVAHFYIEELDIIIFSLISKNTLFYAKFLKDYFKIDLSETSDLVLLPIGFKKPISPLDYISNNSFCQNASAETKKFIKLIVNASKRLVEEEIDETIFVDFKMNLTNINKIKNADIIAGVDNTVQNELTVGVKKQSVNIISSNSGEKVQVTRDKEKSQGVLYYEALSDGIFDEINNIVDANQMLSKGTNQFVLGATLYFRIYAERQYINFNIDKFDLLARTGMMVFYAPFMFWLYKLPDNRIAQILVDSFNQFKTPKIHNLIKIIVLLGDEAVELFTKKIEDKLKGVVQRPDFYYTYLDIIKSKKTNLILKALRTTRNNKIDLKKGADFHIIGDFLDDLTLTKNELSKSCVEVFKGNVNLRSISRELDFIAYSELIINKSDRIIQELKSLLK